VPSVGPVANLEQLLQLLGLAYQPVLVIDDHRIDGAFLEILEHPQVGRPGLAGVLGGRQVVVAVLLDDRPAKARGQGLAVLALPADAEATGLSVTGHAQVQTGLDHSISFAAGENLWEI
jgi:hypothetical protein